MKFKATYERARRVLTVMTFAFFLTLATVLCFGTPVPADDPPDFVIELPAGLACEFDLRVEITGGPQVYKEFFDKNGNLVRALSAGKGSDLFFMNLFTGTTFSLKTGGSVSHITYNPDGSYTQTTTGHNVLILFPTDIPPGPSTTLYVGRVVFTVDLDGVFTLQKVSGKSTDICAALAN